MNENTHYYLNHNHKKTYGVMWFIQLIFACCIVCWLLNPISSNITLLTAFTVGWISVTILMYKNDFMNIYSSGEALKMYIWPIILLFYGLAGHATFSFSYVLYIIIFCIGVFYLIIRDRKSCLIISFLSIVYVSIISVRTLILYQIKPNISRILAYGDPEKIAKYGGEKYLSPFIADYDTVYGTVFLFFVFIALLSNNKTLTKQHKVFVLPATIIFSFLILRAQYFTALLMWIVSICIVLVTKQKQQKNRILLTMLLAMILFILLSFGSRLLNYLSELPDIGYNFSAKLKELAGMLDGNAGDSEGDIGSRSYYYGISIKGFSNHLLFGSGNINNLYVGYGNHSTILDAFAQFGLIGGLPFIIYYITPISMIKKHLDDERKSVFSLLLVLLFILSILNRSNTRTDFALIYIVIPMILTSFRVNPEKQK